MTTITRSPSKVEAFNSCGQLYKGFYIWTDRAPNLKKNPNLCFAKCLVLSGSTPTNFKCRQVEPLDDSQSEFMVPAEYAYNVNLNLDPLNFPDVGMIPHTNDAAALEFIRQRYLKGQIYTEAQPLLVAVNPYKDLGNATDEIILKYRDSSDLDKLPPHVFSIARYALSNLHSVQESQTIIVSGESGAGKTEAVKQVMRYFAAARSGILDTSIQNAVLAANPVLEAFGNAKTIRNNNSSRFGRFIQLLVRPEGGIEAGRVSSFLLEKSRILTQHEDERSYHIFYQLLKGATPQEIAKYKLLPISQYHFLKSKNYEAEGIDDIKDWSAVKASFRAIELRPDEIDCIFSIISGVLLMGNVQIAQTTKMGLPDAADLTSENRKLLSTACSLLHLDPSNVEKWLLTKISHAGSEKVVGCWRQHEAVIFKDSLSKSMYEKLFEWIIERLNRNIQPKAGFQHFMALLDIFGFEVFQTNSLEQLLINITNEMLQKNFIDVVFDRETKLYRAEKISAADLMWTNNNEVIDVLSSRTNSIITSLCDQCLAPNGSDEKFVLSLHRNMKDSAKLLKAKIGPNINFVINHTIGNISYCATNFLFKNKDILRPELVEVARASTNNLVAECFKDVNVAKGRLAKDQLIVSKFLDQLRDLMNIVNSTEPHFIRCVKPNENKAPMQFVPRMVVTQLHSLSIFEALQLRNLGYSYRRIFEEFLFQYRFVNLGIATNTKIPPNERAAALLKSVDISPETWKIGTTMVFMKPVATKKLTNIQREQLSYWGPVVELIEALVLKMRYKKRHDELLPALQRIQARCRMKICKLIRPSAQEINLQSCA